MIDEIKPDDTITYEEAVKAFETLDIYVGRTDTCFLAKCVDVATYPSGLADDLFRKVAGNREEARKPRFEHGAAYCAGGQISSGIYQRRTDGWQLLSDYNLYFADGSEYVSDAWLDSLVKLVPEVTE